MIAMMLPAHFAAGHCLAWVGFASIAAAAQWRFGSVPMNVAVPIVTAALVYELTPLKRYFLRSCSNGIDSVTERAAFSAGLRQGVFCTGCCWLLMAALFVVGATNITLMIALTVFIVGQRLLPYAGRLPLRRFLR